MGSKSEAARVLVVGGPTAAGKSDLALRLAKALDGEVLDVDSVHVYRGMDIGSCKLSRSAWGGIPHHLMDIREPDHPINAADFVREAERVIRDVALRGKLCILCGGSTLYLKALLYGLADLPPADPAVRHDLAKYSATKLHALLLQSDPQTAARIHPNDRKRLVRAWETYLLSGVSQSVLQTRHGFGTPRFDALILVLCRERKDLYMRIQDRTDKILAEGLIEETRRLKERFGPEIAALQTVGYKQALFFLMGKLGRDNLSSEISKCTKRLAKQQMTFWRNEPLKRGWRICPAAGDNSCSLDCGKALGSGGKGTRGFYALVYSFVELEKEIRKNFIEGAPGIELWYLDAHALD